MGRSSKRICVLLMICFFVAVDSVSRKEYLPKYIKTFNAREIKTGSYRLLSVDEKHNQLLVGAENHAFLVDLDDIDKFVSWNLTKPSSSRVSCNENSKAPCSYFVKIMLPFRGRILLCWTKGIAQLGACAWRNRTDFSDASGKDDQGNVFTSENYYPSITPGQNDTSVITENGRLFTGSIPNSGFSLIHSKTFKQPKQREISEASLQAVQFVKSFIIGHYAYFVFREDTSERNGVKLKRSIVARICKGDYGGRYSLKDRFVTFQKAQLSCPYGSGYSFNFNEIQDVWWDETTSLFHAIFASQPNAAASSAICVYSLSAVNRVFDESYGIDQDDRKHDNKYKEFFHECEVKPEYIDPNNHEHVPDGMMATRKMTYREYLLLYPMMADAIQPINSRTWFMKHGIRMTAIALDKVVGHTVVYASTDRGSILKITHKPCLLTEMDIFPPGKREVIKTMVIDTNRHILYMGSSTKLTKLSLVHCSRHLYHSSCIFAADPYCGWDNKTTSCVSVISHGEPKNLKQDLNTCLTIKENAWSQWMNCTQNDGNLCRCQVRPCQETQNSPCEGGLEFRLENCTGMRQNAKCDLDKCSCQKGYVENKEGKCVIKPGKHEECHNGKCRCKQGYKKNAKGECVKGPSLKVQALSTAMKFSSHVTMQMLGLLGRLALSV